MGWGRPFAVPEAIKARYRFDKADWVNFITVIHRDVDDLDVEMKPHPDDAYIDYPDASQLPVQFHFDAWTPSRLTKAVNFTHANCPGRQTHQVRVDSEVTGTHVPAVSGHGHITFRC